MKRLNIIMVALAFIPFQAHSRDDGRGLVEKENRSVATVGQTLRDCPECPDMVVVPPGSFSMGSNEHDYEKPVHRVTIARPYAIGKTEVTQKQWRFVMGNDPQELKSKGCDDCPVEGVGWNDAKEFIQKLNAKTGKQYRLPSEAEWEYACNAGGQNKYCGSDNPDSVAWYDKNSASKTHPAANKQANAFGIYDMSGNVWEWVEDSFHDSYNGAPAGGGAWREESDWYVLRGGSRDAAVDSLRSSLRIPSVPGERESDNGFRLARTLP